jgi:Ca2+-dependent lipid-binding protein
MSKDSTKELGTLVVVVLKAQNLNDKHTLSKQDPYAKISLDGTTQQTEIDKRGGQHPLWDTGAQYIPSFSSVLDGVDRISVSGHEGQF